MVDFAFHDVQYVYTTKCNMAGITNYCSVPGIKKSRADINDIKKALDLFKKHDLDVKILGGNPSDEVNFSLLIEYMNRIGLRYAVTDNGMNYFSLVENKVKGIIFSLDTLGKSNIGGCSFVKSMLAKGVIPWIGPHVDYLAANIVLNRENIKEIEEIIKFLTEHKAVANLCPLIYGTNKNFDFIFRVKENKFALNGLKKDALLKLRKTLIEMKESGYIIGCPVEYLDKLPDVILKNNFGWNCDSINSIPLLRVNSDLSLMVCSDIEGSLSNYSVLDIEEKYNEINNQWIKDEYKKQCCEQNGCYWSNIVISSIYGKKGFGTLEATLKNL